MLETIVGIVFTRILQGQIDAPAERVNYWQRLLKGIMYLFLGFLLFAIILKDLEDLFFWMTCILLFFLSWIAYTKEEFRYARPMLYAVLPLLAISIIAWGMEKFFYKLYWRFEDYFDMAILIAFLWFIGFWWMNRRQQRALEKERLIRLAEEEQHKIITRMNVQLEEQVAERTGELVRQKEALEKTLEELKNTQTQLIQSEKMASLGELTAGIAHEIQNPLNFVNNFSEVSVELLEELHEQLQLLPVESRTEAEELIGDLSQNLEKIAFHGKRADSIVKGMLQHSRSTTGTMEMTDINALTDEYLRLSYHGLRAKDKHFNATMRSEYDPRVGKVMVIPQDFGRVLLNLFNNAFYAVAHKQKLANDGNYVPTVEVKTQKELDLYGGEKVVISVYDNGLGIPKSVLEKIYQPFFTTKPTGEGTGLGLSLSYDIITKGHNGELRVDTEEGEYARFVISLPLR